MAKAFIILVWLAVPASAYYFARVDYADYLSQSRIQRADCLGRADVLGRYTRLIGQRADSVAGIVDAESRAIWQSRWHQLERDLTEEQHLLRRDAPQHYPSTDAKLVELEQLLDSQLMAVESAVRERDAYNKAGGGLEDMLLEIKRAEGIADYYRSIGAQGIYELIRDDVRLLEKEYRERLRERAERNRDMEAALTDSKLYRDQILEGLEQIPGKLDADEQITYSRELQQRFNRFSLPYELSRLLGLPMPEQR